MSEPTIRISWGELIDRITILKIKQKRLRSKESIIKVRKELAPLLSIANFMPGKCDDLAALKSELKTVNERLWDIEDKIRGKEAMKSFDEEFVELARSVYLNNDRRGELKRQINALLQSELGEEKQYTSY
jgi:hypothetical protein